MNAWVSNIIRNTYKMVTTNRYGSRDVFSLRVRIDLSISCRGWRLSRIKDYTRDWQQPLYDYLIKMHGIMAFPPLVIYVKDLVQQWTPYVVYYKIHLTNQNISISQSISNTIEIISQNIIQNRIALHLSQSGRPRSSVIPDRDSL